KDLRNVDGRTGRKLSPCGDTVSDCLRRQSETLSADPADLCPNRGMSARCGVSGGRTWECLPDARYRAAELGNVRPMRRIGRPNSGMFARCEVSGVRTRECSPDARHRTAELGNVRPMRRIGRSNSGIGIYQTEFGLRKRATYI